MLLPRANSLDQLEQPHQVERFGQHLDGIPPGRRPGPGPGREQDNGNGTQAGIPTLASEELTSVHHRHEIIEQDQIRRPDMREYLLRMTSVPSDMYLEALHSKELTEQLPRIGVVVDD